MYCEHCEDIGGCCCCFERNYCNASGEECPCGVCNTSLEEALHEMHARASRDYARGSRSCYEDYGRRLAEVFGPWETRCFMVNKSWYSTVWKSRTMRPQEDDVTKGLPSVWDDDIAETTSSWPPDMHWYVVSAKHGLVIHHD